MNEIYQNPIFLTGMALGLLWLIVSLVQRWREYNLRDKTVLITGASRGLGLVMARQSLAQGARVAICGRDPNTLERANSELQELGEVLAIPCDVTNAEQVQQMVQQVRDRFGQIDVVINNAGAISVGPMEEMTLEDYQSAMNLHFWAPLYVTFALLPAMRQRGAGRIVNISSIGGKVSAPHLLPYSTSKFALTGFSEGLRAEVAKDGIIVTTVCPGLLRTGSPYHATFKGRHRDEYAWFTVSDSLPIISMSAEQAAREIITACKRGKAEVILSLPAFLGSKFHGLFPGLTSRLLAWFNYFLPKPGGIGTQKVQGKDSFSEIAPSIWTTLTDKAAQKYNQIS